MATSQTPSGQITQMKKKLLYTTSNPYEHVFGYHRALRRGPYIAVSGTTALKMRSSGGEAETEGSKVEHPGDAYKQARLAMERCIDGVLKLDGTKEDIIRVKMFVANFDDCGDVGRAYRECFSAEPSDSADSTAIPTDAVGATATMVVVKDGFVDKDILVEVEVDAFCV